MQVATEKKKIESRAFKKSRSANDSSPSPYRWTVDEYYRLDDLGFFVGKHVELIRGEILEKPPMKSPHAASVQLVSESLAKVFVKGFSIRQQLPLAFSKLNEPLPDIAVVVGSIRDYAELHPKKAAMIVEVSDATLSFDRTKKASLYAEFGIEEYWVVNLRDRQVEVNRKPAKNLAKAFYYAEQTIYREDQSVAPLAKPKSKIKVKDILP